MQNLIIILGLGAVWLDIALSVWWPAWLVPIWLWLGIAIWSGSQDNRNRWLWIGSYGVWLLFTIPPQAVGWLILTYFVASEVYSYLVRRFWPPGSILLPFVASFIIVFACQSGLGLAYHHFDFWVVLGKAIVTAVVTIGVLLFYGQKKKGKSQKLI